MFYLFHYHVSSKEAMLMEWKTNTYRKKDVKCLFRQENSRATSPCVSHPWESLGSSPPISAYGVNGSDVGWTQQNVHRIQCQLGWRSRWVNLQYYRRETQESKGFKKSLNRILGQSLWNQGVQDPVNLSQLYLPVQAQDKHNESWSSHKWKVQWLQVEYV